MFQWRTTFHQHATTRCAGDAAEHCTRGCDGQCTRTCRNEQCHGSIETLTERFVDNHPGKHSEHRANDNDRNEYSLESICELLCWRLLCFGIAHHFNHPRQRGVGGYSCDVNLQRTTTIDRPRKHAMRGLELVWIRSGHRLIRDRRFVNGDALAGNRCLVHAALTKADKSVSGQTRIGLDQGDVSNPQIFNLDLCHRTVAPNGCGPRCEFAQRFDRSLGTPHCVSFQGVSQAKQKQQQRAFCPGAQCSGASGCDQHQ